MTSKKIDKTLIQLLTEFGRSAIKKENESIKYNRMGIGIPSYFSFDEFVRWLAEESK